MPKAIQADQVVLVNRYTRLIRHPAAMMKISNQELVAGNLFTKYATPHLAKENRNTAKIMRTIKPPPEKGSPASQRTPSRKIAGTRLKAPLKTKPGNLIEYIEVDPLAIKFLPVESENFSAARTQRRRGL